MLRSLSLAALILAASAGAMHSAKAQGSQPTLPFAPIPSAALLDFIENNPEAFPPEKMRRLMRGYTRVIATGSVPVVQPYKFQGKVFLVAPTSTPVRDHNPPLRTKRS